MNTKYIIILFVIAIVATASITTVALESLNQNSRNSPLGSSDKSNPKLIKESLTYKVGETIFKSNTVEEFKLMGIITNDGSYIVEVAVCDHYSYGTDVYQYSFSFNGALNPNEFVLNGYLFKITATDWIHNSANIEVSSVF